MPTDVMPSQVEDEIAASAIHAAGGFTVVSALFSQTEMAELRAEACIARPKGTRQEHAEFVPTEGRGGTPKRAFRNALSGPVQWRLFTSAQCLASIKSITGLTARPSGSGSFTYYECEGDFLALHRDIETCDLTAITCIDENSTASGGGRLLVYPDYRTESLASTRLAGPTAATPVWLRRGNTILLLGGMVPHELAAVLAGEERVVSVMCYQVLSSSCP